MRLMLLCWRMMSWLWMAGIIVPVKRWQVDADRMTADKGASKCELKQLLICIALESNTGVNRALSTPLLHRTIPGLEFRRMAHLPLRLHPRHHSHRLHPGRHPTLPLKNPLDPPNRPSHPPLPTLRTPPNSPLLRRRPSHHTPHPTRCTRNAQIRLLLAESRVSAVTHPRPDTSVRDEADRGTWIC